MWLNTWQNHKGNFCCHHHLQKLCKKDREKRWPFCLARLSGASLEVPSSAVPSTHVAVASSRGIDTCHTAPPSHSQNYNWLGYPFLTSMSLVHSQQWRTPNSPFTLALGPWLPVFSNHWDQFGVTRAWQWEGQFQPDLGVNQREAFATCSELSLSPDHSPALHLASFLPLFRQGKNNYSPYENNLASAPPLCSHAAPDRERRNKKVMGNP